MSNATYDYAHKLLSISKTTTGILSLSANENIMSEVATSLLSSNLANKYYFETNVNNFSDFPDFVAPGSKEVDTLLTYAKSAVSTMSGGQYVNLAPLSGIHAMIMVILSLSKPGDAIVSIDPTQNGHFSTKALIENLGRKSAFIPRNKDGSVDLSEFQKLVRKQKITLVYLDLMTHLEPMSIMAMRSILDEDTHIVYDASHTLGLILGGCFQQPFAEGASVICGNTHKTFPGPHRGLIIAKDEALGKVIERATAGKLYSSVHFNSLLAMAMTILEMEQYGKAYATAIIKNATLLAELLSVSGFKVAQCLDGSFTKNHQVHIAADSRDGAYRLLTLLRANGIVAHLCFVQSTGFVVRLGSQEITRRGMKEDEIRIIAKMIKLVYNGEDVANQAKSIIGRFNRTCYSFDDKL